MGPPRADTPAEEQGAESADGIGCGGSVPSQLQGEKLVRRAGCASNAVNKTASSETKIKTRHFQKRCTIDSYCTGNTSARAQEHEVSTFK